MHLRPLTLLIALVSVAACGLANSPGAGAAGAFVEAPFSPCPGELVDAPGWQLVETPVVRFCVPPGWAAVKAPSADALVRVQGARGWVEWRVGPFPRALPPPRPQLADGRSDWLPRAGRPAETAIGFDNRNRRGWTYWPPTDDAPALVLLSQSPRDTLHEVLLRSVRLEGAHCLPPRGYFPGGVLSPDDTSGAAFRDLWYSRHLRAMGEPRLAEAAASADEVFRLTVLPSFSPAFAVRLHRRGPSAVVVTTVLSGAGGYEPGEAARHDSVEVTVDDAAAYFQRANAAEFWSMPVQGRDLGLDGSEWILEGVRDGRYHVVDRWTPYATGRHPEFLELANELLRLGGLGPTPSH